MKKFVWIISFMFLIFALPGYGQHNPTEKVAQARLLLNDHRDASHFVSTSPGAFDPVWESMFKNCVLAKNIIFDIPLKTEKFASDHPLSTSYLNYVSVDRYLELIRKLYQEFSLSKIDFQYQETGVDLSRLDSDSILVFEIEKRFEESPVFRRDVRKYLLEVSFINDNPKITAVRLNDVPQVKNEVVLVLDMKDVGKRKPQNPKDIYTIIADLTIDFDEDIYDRKLTEQFDHFGKINLGFLSNRAKVRIDHVYGKNGEKFSIPPDWKSEGKSVNLQPVGGFRVGLKPYIWKGYSITFGLEGGAVLLSKNNTAHFSDDSDFKNHPGFSFGAGAHITRFLNPENWRKNYGSWIYGFGLGLSFHAIQYRVSASQFSQHPYPFTDLVGDSSLVHFAGNQFDEIIQTYAIKIPAYIEIRKKTIPRFGLRSLSLQAGVNVMIPVQKEYDAEGFFSRFGQYPQYNNQLITDDEFYNYYDKKDKDYSGTVSYNAFQFEGMVKMNAFFKLDNRFPDHSLVVSLVASFPFSRSTSSSPNDYFINTGDDLYYSLAQSRDRIYDYYFGLGVGINFINYKVE